MDTSGKILETFKACDTEGNGYIYEKHLSLICPNLNSNEIHQVFLQLDRDGDGKISIEEFQQGFANISSSVDQKENNNGGFIENLNANFSMLSCQEEIYELYHLFLTDNKPNALALFESLISSIIKDIQQAHKQRDDLIRNYEIEKKDVLGEHSKYFETDFGSNLREDQLTKLQNNLSSSDGHSAPTAHFSEIAELRAKIRRLEKIEKEVWGERRLGITRENFEEMKNEIRSLKSCLTDAHTQLTVIKSDFTHLKQKYEDKCFELENEKELVTEYMSEHENLAHQIHSLHDANRRLHGVNEELRTSVEAERSRKSCLVKRNPTSSDYFRAQDDVDSGKYTSEEDSASSVFESPRNQQNYSHQQHQHVINISQPQRMFRVVLAGDSNVGKSSFLMRLCSDIFRPNATSSTIGVDFQTKTIEVEGISIAVQIWDTAGQERFRSVAKSYFKKADGVLLLYDSTDPESFLNVRNWMSTIEEINKLPIILCANKTDAWNSSKTFITTKEGQRLAEEINAFYIETSAKSGKNIEEAVIELSRILCTNEDINVRNAGLQLNENHEKKRKFCCKS